MDIVVDRVAIVKVKAIPTLAEAHKAQLRNDLRLSGARIGLLPNFHAPTLKARPRRFIV